MATPFEEQVICFSGDAHHSGPRRRAVVCLSLREEGPFLTRKQKSTAEGNRTPA
jgi:hypothetical protein